MKKITLTKGKYAIVDDTDYERINQWKWHLDNGYAARSVRFKQPVDGKTRTTVRMHRVIMGAEKGQEIDHINGDKLDNRKSNLRFCAHRDNMKNIRKKSHNTSGFIGVYWSRANKRWIAHAKDSEGGYVYLGAHSDPMLAARARDGFVKENYGEFAVLNIT